MSKFEIITAVVAGYGAILASYTLYIQIRDRLRRVSVTILPGYIEAKGGLSDTMIILKGSNIGHIAVSLSSYSIKLPDPSKLFFPPRNNSTHQLPHTLEPGTSFQAWLPAAEISSELLNHGFTGSIKLAGIFEDQTGKM